MCRFGNLLIFERKLISLVAIYKWNHETFYETFHTFFVQVMQAGCCVQIVTGNNDTFEMYNLNKERVLIYITILLEIPYPNRVQSRYRVESKDSDRIHRLASD